MTSPAFDASATPDSEPDGLPSCEQTEGLRERKKRETRRRIHHCALDLVAEHGIAGITTEQIAAAAEVSPRTFFNYFPTKDAAIVGASPDLPERLAAHLLKRPAAEDILTALRAVLLAAFGTLTSDEALRRRRRDVFARHPELSVTTIGMTMELEKVLSAAVAQRLEADPNDPYPRLIAAATLAVTRAAFVHAQYAPQHPPIADTLQLAFAQVLQPPAAAK
ncbi:acyl-CoA-like ligand-binding transcription factor [Gephyromycinifex aptenodytis]|uniref:acyl-CoA-like ligand-binding transcription factor n=1 Tax=Gephyromycinifex aptenodytis TaxID=2716227 RepID=UPI0014462C2E|nr:TetR family transcriptional regulator [Gephyromycinifex aptenodytis]